jgi:hypothetical protein
MTFALLIKQASEPSHTYILQAESKSVRFSPTHSPFVIPSERRIIDLALLLSDRACDRRKHVVGVRSDQTDRPHDDYQNDRQHYCIFCNVLSFFLPQTVENILHATSCDRQALGPGAIRCNLPDFILKLFEIKYLRENLSPQQRKATYFNAILLLFCRN